MIFDTKLFDWRRSRSSEKESKGTVSCVQFLRRFLPQHISRQLTYLNSQDDFSLRFRYVYISLNWRKRSLAQVTCTVSGKAANWSATSETCVSSRPAARLCIPIQAVFHTCSSARQVYPLNTKWNPDASASLDNYYLLSTSHARGCSRSHCGTRRQNVDVIYNVGVSCVLETYVNSRRVFNKLRAPLCANYVIVREQI